MPRLRSRSGPIVKCAYRFCDIQFRKWRKRLYCSDPCKKNEWKAAHKPYYAQLRKERWERIKAANRHSHRYRWVEEGKEEEAPERLTLAESIAQATPEAISQIKEILGPDVE